MALILKRGKGMSWQELLIGPTFGGSIGGVCPDNSYLWHNSDTNISHCCCSHGCCWAACSTTVVGHYPPNNCLPEGAHWIKRRAIGSNPDGPSVVDWHAVKGRFRFEVPNKDSMLLFCRSTFTDVERPTTTETTLTTMTNKESPLPDWLNKHGVYKLEVLSAYKPSS